MFQTISGKELYRIGDCIISVNAENPSLNYGGQWELLCPGRTLVCVDTSQSEFNALKKTGGSKYLQSHNHSGSSGSGGSHGHTGSLSINQVSLTGYADFRDIRIGDSNTILEATGNLSTQKVPWDGSHWAMDGQNASSYQRNRLNLNVSHSHSGSLTINSNGSHSHTVTINSNGSGDAQNLQPFMAVFIWVRVA